MKNILIIGATSSIAIATARLLAEKGFNYFLIARDNERLEKLAADLKIRGANNVYFDVLDINIFTHHKIILENAKNKLGNIDIALIAHGMLPDQKDCEKDFELTLASFNTNTLSTISLLTHLANIFETQKTGTIAVIGSVAGDRGRQSNYVYGAEKASVSIYTQGLRNRLFPYGVHVMTIKPGFVDTPMTQQFRKNFLWSKPERIAKGIIKAIDSKKNTVYLPGYWRFIMWVIRSIPENIFVRLRL